MTRATRRLGTGVGVTVLFATALLGVAWLSPAPLANEVPSVDEGVDVVSAPPSFADLIERVKPAVVNISTTTTMPAVDPRMPAMPGWERDPGVDSLPEFFQRFFDLLIMLELVVEVGDFFFFPAQIVDEFLPLVGYQL